MAAVEEKGPPAAGTAQVQPPPAKDPDRIATSFIVAGILFLLLAVADTIAVRGLGLGTLWGGVLGAVFLIAAVWNWKKRAPSA